MFDTIRISESPRYPQTVHEHKAPTDESVRLLREMEAAAEKRVFERGHVQNSELDVRWCIYWSNDSDSEKVRLRYKYGGRPVTLDLCASGYRYLAPKDRAIFIQKAVIESLSKEIVHEIFKTDYTTIFGIR